MRSKKRPKPLTCSRIIVDSGPLMVLLCATGQFRSFDADDMRRICSNDKEMKFYLEHGEEVLKIIGKKRIVITPHVVAEVSNRVKAKGFDVGKLLDEENLIVKLLLSKGEEQHLSLKHLLQHIIFKNHRNLGVTDCALMILTRGTDLLLTHDSDLKLKATGQGLAVMFPQDVYYSVTNWSTG